MFSQDLLKKKPIIEKLLENMIEEKKHNNIISIINKIGANLIGRKKLSFTNQYTVEKI